MPGDDSIGVLHDILKTGVLMRLEQLLHQIYRA